MTVVASVLVGALALAGPAAAQNTSPTTDAYGDVAAEVVTPSQGSDDQPTQQVAAETAAPAPTAAAQPASADEGSLPFTGLQATLVLLAGAALLGTGVVLRRATTNS